jgi:hypothetical protein
MDLMSAKPEEIEFWKTCFLAFLTWAPKTLPISEVISTVAEAADDALKEYRARRPGR